MNNRINTKFLNRLVLCALLLVSSMVVYLTQAYAATTSQTIRFSNIGGGTGSAPNLYNSTTVTGLSIDGKTMVKLSDIASLLGASISYNPYNSNEWILTRNGQEVRFYNGSTSFGGSIGYSIKYPSYYASNASSKSHSVSWSGYSDVNSQIINSEKYVRLTTAANQLGALLVSYDSTSKEARVYDWRVKGTTPISDSNQYVVGGPWIYDWNNKGSVYLTDHFTAGELRDKSSSTSNPSYYSQLKMSVNQLQSLENVRYHYNNNSGFTPTSGFRSWYHNSNTSGSWDRSYHLRGRAWDAGEDWLYDSTYNEFKGSSSTPIDAGSGFWRTRVSNGLSQGYEIEKMEGKSSKWLHLQRIPGIDSAYYGP